MFDIETNVYQKVVQMWEKAFPIILYAVTSEDTIIPCRKDVSGRYHVDGDLLLAPPEMLSPYIRNCLPIMHQLEDFPKIL
jgi:hypothetical protein